MTNELLLKFVGNLDDRLQVDCHWVTIPRYGFTSKGIWRLMVEPGYVPEKDKPLENFKIYNIEDICSIDLLLVIAIYCPMVLTSLQIVFIILSSECQDVRHKVLDKFYVLS